MVYTFTVILILRVLVKGEFMNTIIIYLTETLCMLYGFLCLLFCF